MSQQHDSDQMELIPTSSPEGSPAKIYRSLESRQASRVADQDYGASSTELLAKYDLDTRSWKTSQLSLLETEGDGLAAFSETWPRSGMTVNGIAFQLPPLVRLTAGTGYGLLPTHSIPTPTTQDHIKRECTSTEKLNFLTNKSVSLDRFVRMWPTPSAQEPGWKNIEVVDGDGNKPTHPNQRFYDKKTGRLVQKGLPQVARMWPTPTSVDGIRGIESDDARRARGANTGTTLNDATAKWSTPRASEYKGVGPLGSKSHRHRLARGYLDATVQERERATGTLNPAWVCWLMGFPLDWLDLDGCQNPELIGLHPTYLTESQN